MIIEFKAKSKYFLIEIQVMKANAKLVQRL